MKNLTISQVNEMDPVDFEKGLYDTFKDFLAQSYLEHGLITNPMIQEWFRSTAYYLDQPGIDKIFQYSREEIEKVVKIMAKEEFKGRKP